MVSARNGKVTARGSRAGSSKQPTASSSPAPHQPKPGLPSPSNSKNGVKTRQRRVLPTRSRRGGPGVGSCETDVMILETMRRKFESEPLIPATISFLLTTNAALLPSNPTSASAKEEESESHVNTLAFTRYFDRPEVRKAYKEQQLIQTPEFTELPQDAHVGGRFRPRGSEDDAVDTSDAAYEKRHRKYETFEKRQRLREKEKLKHEHYKLKERIDQLRAMDTSAFLALPASDFTEDHGHYPGSSGQDEATTAADASNLHGAAAYHEGERRRKEMLEVALLLEARYRTLLPPDRRWMEKKTGKPRSKAISVEAVEHTDEEGEEEEEEMEGESEAEEQAAEDDGESEIDPEEIERRKSKQLKLRIKFPPRMLSSKQESKPPPQPTRGGGKQITLSPFFKYPYGGKGQTASSPFRSASYAAPEAPSKYGRYSEDTEDTLPQPASKRQRVHASASAKLKSSKAYTSVETRDFVSSTGLAGKKEPTTCVLMVAALRQSTAPSARKTQRHVTAFGARVPQELEEIRDFEIPHWVLATRSASDDGDRQGSYDTYSSYGRGARSDDGYSVSVDATDPGT